MCSTEYQNFGTVTISGDFKDKFLGRARICNYAYLIFALLGCTASWVVPNHLYEYFGADFSTRKSFVMPIAASMLLVSIFGFRFLSTLPLRGMAQSLSQRVASELDLSPSVQRNIKKRLLMEPWCVSPFQKELTPRDSVTKIGSMFDTENRNGYWIMRINSQFSTLRIERMSEGFSRMDHEGYIKHVVDTEFRKPEKFKGFNGGF